MAGADSVELAVVQIVSGRFPRMKRPFADLQGLRHSFSPSELRSQLFLLYST
jgi:hypothetical protein